jgi:hypothetical protein
LQILGAPRRSPNGLAKGEQSISPASRFGVK